MAWAGRDGSPDPARWSSSLTSQFRSLTMSSLPQTSMADDVPPFAVDEPGPSRVDEV